MCIYKAAIGSNPIVAIAISNFPNALRYQRGMQDKMACALFSTMSLTLIAI